MFYDVRENLRYGQTLENKKREMLIKELKGEKENFIKPFLNKIHQLEEEIKSLTIKKVKTSNIEETKEIERKIKHNESRVSRLAKRVEKYRHQILKINKIRWEYLIIKEKQRLDGNAVSPIEYDEYDRDILRLLNIVLRALEEKRTTKLYEVFLDIKESNIEKKFKKELEKLKKLGTGVTIDFSGTEFEMHNLDSLMGDVHFDSHLILKTLIFKDSPLNLLDKEGKIHLMNYAYLNKVKLLDASDSLDELKEFFATHIKEIKEIQKLRELGYWNDFVDLENLYKEYANHYIGALVIKDIIPKLSKDPVHKSEIKRLEKIVEKHLKIAEKLKREADKKLISLKEKLKKENKFIDSKEFETSEVIDTPQVVDTKTEVKEIETPQVVDTKQESEKKEEIKETELNENEIKSISAGYRRRYVEERAKGTELGKMTYSEYLRHEYPNQKELIAYVEKLEGKGKTLYEEYLEERAYRTANGYSMRSFKEFVRFKTGQEYYDVDMELTQDIQEELKRMKAL